MVLLQTKMRLLFQIREAKWPVSEKQASEVLDQQISGRCRGRNNNKENTVFSIRYNLKSNNSKNEKVSCYFCNVGGDVVPLLNDILYPTEKDILGKLFLWIQCSNDFDWLLNKDPYGQLYLNVNHNLISLQRISIMIT